MAKVKKKTETEKMEEFVDLLFSRWVSKHRDRERLAVEVAKAWNDPQKRFQWEYLAKCKEWRMIK
jgi:hypothetical protein